MEAVEEFNELRVAPLWRTERDRPIWSRHWNEPCRRRINSASGVEDVARYNFTKVLEGEDAQRARARNKKHGSEEETRRGMLLAWWIYVHVERWSPGLRSISTRSIGVRFDGPEAVGGGAARVEGS